jgi:hypothetical protein
MAASASAAAASMRAQLEAAVCIASLQVQRASSLSAQQLAA